MEEWKEIYEFPGYSVSNYGRVRNDHTGRLLALLQNQAGIINVGMNKGAIQHKRSLPLLVALAFVYNPNVENFDTPVHLDGDRTNNYAENLVWRPRWFAVEYQRQFAVRRNYIKPPIRDTATGEVYESTWDAVTRFGLLNKDLTLAILNQTVAWPTYQRFEIVEV